MLCVAHAQHELERTHEEHERERAILAQQGQRRPCATSESRVTREGEREREASIAVMERRRPKRTGRNDET